ncbi:unannotated protein [freshwater metagenome]|uniref:Unannotated protein n=1 Tax=freshwater metagenome TaxID=449393 RepID=A0A6J7D437_9ZZZZ
MVVITSIESAALLGIVSACAIAVGLTPSIIFDQTLYLDNKRGLTALAVVSTVDAFSRLAITQAGTKQHGIRRPRTRSLRRLFATASAQIRAVDLDATTQYRYIG